MTMNALSYHILAQLDSGPAANEAGAVDQKGEFGQHVNRQPRFARSQNMPEFVRENLPVVARREFALTPPATDQDQQPIAQSEYRDFWVRELENEPWDIYSIAESMATEFDINRGWAFKNARQHLNQLILQARMRGYRQERLVGRRFRWGGPPPEHPACQWLVEQIPDEGLPFNELVEKMQEAKRRFVEDAPSSPHVMHDWCRHEIREVQ